MLNSALIKLLQARRENDVFVQVPVFDERNEPAGYLDLETVSVGYDPKYDRIIITTSGHYLGEEGE